MKTSYTKFAAGLSIIAVLGLAAATTAMGYVYPDSTYYGDSTYGYGYNYNYDYPSSMYGPSGYYNRPIYRVTSTVDPSYYTAPVYTAPAYTAPAAYAYSYNYQYSYNNGYGPYYGTTYAPYTTTVYDPYYVPTDNSPYSGRFLDVSPSDPYYAAIQWVDDNDIANGFSNGRYFQPNRSVTRAEFVAMVVKAKHVNPSTSTFRNCYNDVHDEWFANEVCYADRQGWVPNAGSDFNPSRAMTASDIRTVIERAFGSYPGNLPSTTYLTRSQAAGVLYDIVVRGNIGASNYYLGYNRNYNPVYYPTTTTEHYQYNPYSGDYYSPPYRETGYYNNYYGYNNYNNNYYNSRYVPPVYVPAGYNIY